MFISRCDDEHFDILRTARISAVKAIKVYYLVNGRNVWHRKWNKTFDPSQLFLSDLDAKEAAEDSRKPGTKFYVEELPALLLVSKHGNVIVSEINCAKPLAEYRVAEGLVRHRRAIARAARSFDWMFGLWKNPRNEYYTVFLMYDDGLFSEYVPLDRTPLCDWQSSAWGSNYKLIWSPVTPDRSPEAVKGIVRASRSKLKGKSASVSRTNKRSQRRPEGDNFFEKNSDGHSPS